MIFGKRRPPGTFSLPAPEQGMETNLQPPATYTYRDAASMEVVAPTAQPTPLRGIPTGRNIPRQRPPGTFSLPAPEQGMETNLQPATYPYPLPAKEAARQIRAEIGDIRKALERAKQLLDNGAVPFEDVLPVQVHLDDVEGYLCFIEYNLRCMLGDVES